MRVRNGVYIGFGRRVEGQIGGGIGLGSNEEYLEACI